MSSDPNLTLYTAQTPNGVKISIALELLGVPYKAHKISFDKSEQKQPWFLEINPNGRIPALTDSNPPGINDGKPLHFMESGAILLYLVETYDPERKISFPKGTREHWEMVQWVLWQNAGLGPMQGQCNHFYRYAPEKIQYGIDRYHNETRRLYGVLDKRLGEQSDKGGWIAGDHISIADITSYGWAESAFWGGVDLSEFPKVQEWMLKLRNIEAVAKGADVPEPSKLKALRDDPVALEEHAKAGRAWIMKGVAEDAKK